MMNYEILGQIRVSGRPGVSAPRARKIETLLAVLLAKNNQVVTTEYLIGEIWGEHPPARASAALYVYVSQLRKLLRGTGEADESPVVTSPRGYSLHVGIDELDADRFTRLYQEGRALHWDRSYGQAATVLRQAADLWRGDAFGGFTDSPDLQAYASLLEESRLECLELLMETELLIGRHREVVGQLSALAKEHTLRETFYEYLMTALLRSNRRAEALETFASARQNLVQQLGIEPGSSLRKLHHSILVGELSDAV
ncbi:AfsR/SARP family transcriptional regulator [Amycolatopsis saalfeldensis]|uniref:DNA-binding transcriptional activator of the SARP family n=1 Tax=Amycolatopsis saalfeldensis TaxID=394193 RepID=A0A1H8PXM1_9PSEU|nr:AfsR/SARP family transcriptional regulator [Amycolatopsis saalfeldensis]SEO46293.1 DNA-binding transcriptional activator of the SARP family [Amycolatopsis saalfeldensis]